MKKVYLVSRGSYSDYSIVALFSSKEKAETFMAYHPKTGYDSLNDLEEFELDGPTEFPVGKLAFRVRFTRDGEMEVAQTDPQYVRDFVRPYGDGKTMCTECWAADEKAAAKIANERRAQVIAENQWETDHRVWLAWHRQQALATGAGKRGDA